MFGGIKFSIKQFLRAAKNLWLFVIFHQFLFLLPAIADPFSGPAVVVKLRAVGASGKASSESNIDIDKRLADLRDRLMQLHYASYRLLASKRELVPVKKKHAIKFLNGNVLTVRPFYVDKERVGMRLNWEDPQGVKVLDTRMHFNCGEPMITGAEKQGQEGLILAIDVSPSSGK